ncbi:Transcriptional regulator, LysR family [Cystobacter fuscus DSM 2262]|uniref:Transcriptional regulator, LysR family n=1 Tax=Cystobacter fuscus (strain ATCC 25194 / DSM 2262 / NBRC 100088 / M29) TaxID=1242864 RepID=S9Q9P5_CYSF2|nr:LysR family transcriptional regulator [Cystobacter fuscus]EPX58054.1 Transcriptional regulator, LysR family [Cystobacter fuscus DSM 2262]
MDRLRAFEVFTTVVQRGSFTRAADALDTSAANVTRYVNELERHLGTRLLHRTPRHLSLTESGQALHEHVRGILDDVAEAEALASASTVQARGRLRLNAPLSFGILHLAPLWPRFMALHPDVELDVSLSDRVVDLVEEGYDLAIRISREGAAASQVTRRLSTSRNVVCAAPAYLARAGRPKRLEDLAAHVCIAYSNSSMAEEWPLTDAAGNTRVVRMRSVMQANNGDTVRAAALAGRGLTWQPTFLIGDDLRAGRLVRVLPDHSLPDIDILAVYPSRRHLSAKVRLMIDFLAEQLRGTPSWDRT